MATTLVEEFTNKAEARIKELRPLVDEMNELEAQVAALRGASNGGSKRKSSGSTGNRRGRQGKRAEEVVAVIKENPGIQVSEISRKVGVKPNYLYRVTAKLAEQGAVVREGKGYKVAA